MRRSFDHRSEASPDRAREVLGDLATYERWFPVIDRVEAAPPHTGDDGPAWNVTLRARLGRFSRAKRLRMVRVVDDDTRVVFQRHEHDGRRHSDWRLTAVVGPDGSGSEIDFELHYGGGLLEPIVARLLDGEVEASRPRLEAVLVAD